MSDAFQAPPIVQVMHAVEEIDSALGRMIQFGPSPELIAGLGAATAGAVSTLARCVGPLLGVVAGLQRVVDDMRAEVIAIEKELGTEPSGVHPDVRSRLEAIDRRIAGVAGAIR